LFVSGKGGGVSFYASKSKVCSARSWCRKGWLTISFVVVVVSAQLGQLLRSGGKTGP
jgi:hypothetical protein